MAVRVTIGTGRKVDAFEAADDHQGLAGGDHAQKDGQAQDIQRLGACDFKSLP